MEGYTLEAWNEDNERLEQLLPELGCLMGIKSITASYMPFELSDFGIRLVIQAIAALESIVKGGTPDQCGNAIVLLQYIHSRFPEVAVETYVRLLVDLKTKVRHEYEIVSFPDHIFHTHRKNRSGELPIPFLFKCAGMLAHCSFLI